MKIYKRYAQEKVLGIVSSGLVLAGDGDSCITASLTDLVEWDVKKGTKNEILKGEEIITCITSHRNITAIG